MGWIGDAATTAGGVITIMLSNPTTLNGGEQQWIDQQKQKDKDYNAYKNRCNQPPPPGLSPCALARWKLQRNMDCRNMRQAWDDKWMPGRQASDIQNLNQSIANLEAWIRKNCKDECK